MRVLTFQPRFHDAIRRGTKRSTIRAKARCKPGDVLSLRRWLDKPYRSKQEELLKVTCTGVRGIVIWEYYGKLEARTDYRYYPFSRDELALFATSEGFTDAADMQKWFDDNHGLKQPFVGELITWTAE